MNKRTLPLLGLVLCVTLSTSAQKPLTNEAIWYSNTFSSDQLSGLVSMNDGTHYTTMDRGEAGV
ncbi:MAG TPA: hypothetical protein PLL18_00215, partial [Flavobacteriales bacterium]|nr:hypothetical protein [Flavobacteriales bacterium]